MSTNISFLDDVSNLSKHSITLSFQRDNVKENEMKTVNTKVSFDVVDKFVKKINILNKDIITNYDYNIINDDEIDICILWKHIFKKFGEKQRFCYFKVYVMRDKEKLLFREIDSNKYPIKNIPVDAEKMSIKNGSVSYTENADNILSILVKYTNTTDLTSPNKSLIENFISNSFLNSIDDLKQSIHIVNGTISIL
jgi:hypothetical protein